MGRRPCCNKEGLNRGAWSASEDKILIDYIQIHGEGKWGTLPKSAGLRRCWKSCRLRWMNYLRPDIKRGNISDDEEDLIIRLHKLLGNRWSLIAGRLPGRTDNEIKNYWNSKLAKKVNDEQKFTNKLLGQVPMNQVDFVSPLEENRKILIRNTAGEPPATVDEFPALEFQSNEPPVLSGEDEPLNSLIDFNIGELGVSEFLNDDFSQLSNGAIKAIDYRQQDLSSDLQSLASFLGLEETDQETIYN